jgi:hypothetical protein
MSDRGKKPGGTVDLNERIGLVDDPDDNHDNQVPD